MTFLSSLLGRIAASLPAERRVLARRGWVGEIAGLSEQPATKLEKSKEDLKTEPNIQWETVIRLTSLAHSFRRGARDHFISTG
jgi:hypothetical protein